MKEGIGEREAALKLLATMPGVNQPARCPRKPQRSRPKQRR